MKAMIFAAGLGKRMLPLTERCPKPLLKVANKALIIYQLEKLAAVGIKDVVINVSYLAHTIMLTLGDGQRWGLNIQYSIEPEPLETFGGLMQAMDLLAPEGAQAEPFLLVNADVYCDIDFAYVLEAAKLSLSEHSLGYLLMVDNPPHNPEGDFCLDAEQGVLQNDGDNKLTFSGISVLTPTLLERFQAPSNKLAELFIAAMHESALMGGHYHGLWRDIGTPERLYELDQQLLSED